jgi:hypothetical protein
MHDVYGGAPHVHRTPSFGWQSLAAKPLTIGVGARWVLGLALVGLSLQGVPGHVSPGGGDE